MRIFFLNFCLLNCVRLLRAASQGSCLVQSRVALSLWLRASLVAPFQKLCNGDVNFRHLEGRCSSVENESEGVFFTIVLFSEVVLRALWSIMYNFELERTEPNGALCVYWLSSRRVILTSLAEFTVQANPSGMMDATLEPTLHHTICSSPTPNHSYCLQRHGLATAGRTW